MKQIKHTAHQQTGFTFIESLLSLFIMSVGLLGVAGMHAQALQTAVVASQRVSAVSQVDELLERMRANPGGLDGYKGAAASHSCTSGSSCTPLLMAADDLFTWGAEVDDMFFSPQVDVDFDDVDAGLDPNGDIVNVTVTINWSAKNVDYSYATTAEIAKYTP